jgi:BirA family transcriptional regulator, biotin operon repressor / biotin---[acetyl-CoA-carboxylase] ligase
MNAERELLLCLRDGPVSGDLLARAAGQTRAAVWKRIEALRAAGVEIEAQAGRGYRLAAPLDLLDAEQIRAQVSADAGACLGELDVKWSVDSTNAELLRRAAPERGAVALLAETQTSGRGRRGREWTSPLAANLYLSVLRVFAGGLARLGGLSLVAGVAAVEALHALGYRSVQLKWPNDLVFAGTDGGLLKLGGLLVEGGGEHAGPVRAVIGLGLNVRMPGAAAQSVTQPWTDLASLPATAGGVPTRSNVAAMLLTHLLPALDVFDRGGLAPFLPRLAASDALRDREVTVHDGAGEHVGKALGLAADGALRVGLAQGERSFHAGEVSVRLGAEIRR